MQIVKVPINRNLLQSLLPTESRSKNLRLFCCLRIALLLPQSRFVFSSVLSHFYGRILVVPSVGGNYPLRRFWRCGLSTYHNIGQNDHTLISPVEAARSPWVSISLSGADNPSSQNQPRQFYHWIHNRVVPYK